MVLTLITPAGQEPLSVAEVQNFIRSAFEEEVPLLKRLICSVREQVESYTGLSLITRTWKLTMEASCEKKRGLLFQKIALPRPPFQKLLEARHLKGTKVMSLKQEEYVVEKTLLDPLTTVVEGKFSLNKNIQQNDVIELIYTNGFGRDPHHVPEMLKQALLIGVAEFYENRGALPFNLTFLSLLKPFRYLTL